MNQHPKGFSLIELIIVVAIVGILASVVIPSYNNQIMKSRRTDATIALSELAHAMERYHTTRGNYKGAQTSDANPAPAGTVYSATSPEGFYDLSVTVPDANPQRYTVTAAPDASEAMANDTVCGTYSLDHRQVKCVTVSSTSYCSDGNAAARDKVRQCW